MDASAIRSRVLELLEANGPMRFKEFRPLMDEIDSVNFDGMRAVDRALQALRKRGSAVFDSKLGWSKSEPRRASGAGAGAGG